MKVEEKSPDEIVQTERLQHSSWHFLQARSWIDLAKRKPETGPLHYAAFELRYGIEVLLFEILVLRKKGLSEHDYKRCLGSPSEMRKMLKSESASYDRLMEFTEICLSLDPNPDAPKLVFWKLNDLFRYWGIASEFLHFVGHQKATYDSPQWYAASISRLDEAIEVFWRASTTTTGFGLSDPTTMPPIVQETWESFRSGKISREDLEARLDLIAPIAQDQMRRKRNGP